LETHCRDDEAITKGWHGNKMIISLRKLSYILLLLSVVSYPINYSVGGLRLIDVLFFIALFVSMPFLTLKKNNLLLVLWFLIVFWMSILLGNLFIGNFSVERIIFVYKYLYPFCLILIFYNLNLSSKQLIFLMKLMFFSHIALSVWVFIYIYLVSTGQIHGSFRVSFPFSNDYASSDAHLLSSVLAIGAVFFTMFFKKLYSSQLIFFVLLVFSISAIVLTGSRTGLLIFIIGICLYSLSIDKKSLSVVFWLLVSIGMGLGLFVSSGVPIPDEIMILTDRIMGTDISTDSSFLGRIEKTGIGLSESGRMYFLLGVGVLHSELVWYDSLVGSLMSHVGLLGSMIFIALLFKFWRNTVYAAKTKTKSAKIVTIMLLCYVIANLITEYYLVSRSVFPFLVYLLILREYIKLEGCHGKFWTIDESVVSRKIMRPRLVFDANDKRR